MSTTSSAIGEFQIGISPIGVQPSTFDYTQTVISQYANSPILMQMLSNFEQYIDPTANIEAFFDMVFNVNTAQGFGLDIWGRIVGVNRVITTQSDLDFGFAEAGSTSAVGFGQGEFYNGTSLTNNTALSDDAFRTLIYAKMLYNISDGSIAGINQILLNLFPGRGNCYVRDNLNMTLTYVFTFATTPVEQAIVQGSGVLPKPAGVLALFSFA